MVHGRIKTPEREREREERDGERQEERKKGGFSRVAKRRLKALSRPSHSREF